MIHADGELQASEKLPVAEVPARQPQALQLRYLVAADKNSTIVFPLPLDIVGPLLDAMKRPR